MFPMCSKMRGIDERPILPILSPVQSLHGGVVLWQSSLQLWMVVQLVQTLQQLFGRLINTRLDLQCRLLVTVPLMLG